MRPIVYVLVTFPRVIPGDDSFRVRAASLLGNAGECGGLERVQGRLCVPLCGVVSLQLKRCHSVPRGRWPHCPRSESGAEDQGAVSPLSPTGGRSRTSFVVCLSVRRSAGGVSGCRACRVRVRRGVGRNPVIGGPGPCHVEQDQHKICACNGSEDRGDQPYQSYATYWAAK